MGIRTILSDTFNSCCRGLLCPVGTTLASALPLENRIAPRPIGKGCTFLPRFSFGGMRGDYHDLREHRKINACRGSARLTPCPLFLYRRNRKGRGTAGSLSARAGVMSAWPDTGRLEVVDVVMRYRAYLNPSLNGINMVVQAGEKVELRLTIRSMYIYIYFAQYVLMSILPVREL